MSLNIKSLNVGLASAAVLIFVALRAQAGDIEWSGMYRAEGVQLHHPSMDSGTGKNKDYGVHTLFLRPKIIAADGLYISSQFNIFNSTDTTLGNQFGEYFGNGPGDGSPTSVNDSNSTAEASASSQIRVSQFYLTHVQEYGALIVGRSPLQFGLGISHNAGTGLFDHYSDTRDMVGYKISMGNFYFLPMYAKISEGNAGGSKIGGYDDVNEINFQLQYENPETDSSMGVFYQNRKSSAAGNDAPGNSLDIDGSTTTTSGYAAKNFNVFFKKETPSYGVGFEIAQQGGKSGVRSSNGKEIEFSGFGVALEYAYHAQESKNIYGLKAGFATGDDPKTKSDYEGFIFDRNYDVAMFLFNQGLGQADLLHTKAIGRTDRLDVPAPGGNQATVDGQPDVEAISNVTYVSAYFSRKWTDKWTMVGALTTGWLNDSTIRVGGATGTNFKAASDIGYELDISAVYNATEKITWINQFGYLYSGSAWEVDGQFDSSEMYGFITKAAVSF